MANFVPLLLRFIGKAEERLTHRISKVALLAGDVTLRTIFQCAVVAMVFTDANRHIRLVNPAFTRMFGYTSEHIVGRITEFLYKSLSYFAQQRSRRLRTDAVNTDVPTPALDMPLHQVWMKLASAALAPLVLAVGGNCAPCWSLPANLEKKGRRYESG